MNRRMCFFIVLSVAAINLLFPSQMWGQTFSVSGRVIHHTTLNGLNNVQVKIGNQTVLTDINGEYTFSLVSAGSHLITASLADFTIDSLEIDVINNLTGQNLIAYPGKTLSVVPLKARKDTTLLCLNGCKRSGPNAWNQSRENSGTVGIHDYNYCVPTAIAMINRFYGGNLTRDEIMSNSNQFRTPDWEQELVSVTVQGELGHGGGVVLTSYGPTLRWAHNNPAGVDVLTTEPTESEYKGYIDAGRPLLWTCNWENSIAGHAMVISGYRYENGKFQLLFLNTDNEGSVVWKEKNSNNTWTFSGLNGSWGSTMVLPANAVGRQKDPRVDLDTDGDGVSDYDEIIRWDEGPIHKQDLKEDNADTDNDGLPDGKDIEGWLFRGQNNPIGIGTSDLDGDDKRGEIDPDSDNGGVRDGDEDFNHDANKNGDETDPYEPIKPNADDIPKVKVTLTPSIQRGDKIFVSGNVTGTFVFYRQDGTTLLPIFDKEAGPLTVKIIYSDNTESQVNLTPVGAIPTATWTGELTIVPVTRADKAEFVIKNGLTEVEVVEGEEFFIDIGNTNGNPPN